MNRILIKISLITFFKKKESSLLLLLWLETTHQKNRNYDSIIETKNNKGIGQGCCMDSCKSLVKTSKLLLDMLFFAGSLVVQMKKTKGIDNFVARDHSWKQLK